MKKFLAMLCMLTCLLGLTACGGEKPVSEVDKAQAENAVIMATDFVIPYMASFSDDELAAALQDNYNVHELEAIMEDEFGYMLYVYTNMYGMQYGFSEIKMDGNAVLNAISSFNGTYASLGDIKQDTAAATYKISGKQIIVTVPVTGTVEDKNGNPKKGEVEVIFSNDIFLRVESCTLNLNQTKGELMGKAASDTLMGMGTVFVVLILISFIIYLLGFVPKLFEGGRKSKAEVKKEAVDNTIAQIIEKEESDAKEESELELVAVIAAAIAASEGAAGTDGFVVRSIRKIR